MCVGTIIVNMVYYQMITKVNKMGVTKEQWNSMKEEERFGMIANILSRLRTIEQRLGLWK